MLFWGEGASYGFPIIQAVDFDFVFWIARQPREKKRECSEEKGGIQEVEIPIRVLSSQPPSLAWESDERMVIKPGGNVKKTKKRRDRVERI